MLLETLSLSLSFRHLLSRVHSSTHLSPYYFLAILSSLCDLQTIKNSDLEEIRELGSGTYGTVFFGKWKGSDVAIKRIKPSCFDGGELGEDRLVIIHFAV